MGYQLRVAIAVVIVAEVAAVALGNYSIATGGGHAAADQMRGDTVSASRRMAHAAEESKEVVGNWAGWAKDKAQEGLGFCVDQAAAAGSSGVTQQIAETTRKGKEKMYDAVSGAAHKASETAQQAKDAICATTVAQEDTEDAQESPMENSTGGETQAQTPAKAQENLSWPKNGCKRKASDHLDNARKKISLGGGASHGGEL